VVPSEQTVKAETPELMVITEPQEPACPVEVVVGLAERLVVVGLAEWFG